MTPQEELAALYLKGFPSSSLARAQQLYREVNCLQSLATIGGLARTERMIEYRIAEETPSTSTPQDVVRLPHGEISVKSPYKCSAFVTGQGTKSVTIKFDFDQ